MTPLLVALAGGLGAALRFAVDGEIRSRVPRHLPVSTIVVNVTGSALLGALAAAHVHGALPATAFVVAATGFCGGFTTFSTSVLETVRLAQAGAHRLAVANAAGTLVLAVVAAAVGYGVVSGLV